ncbi:MAG: hypothetical protein ACLFQX_03120 [Candidatus Kapaibacterium sp.]
MAFVLTLGIAVYQRTTGPTYPISGEKTIAGENIEYRLTRSHGGEGDEVIPIVAPDEDISGVMSYRRYRSHDQWKTEPLERSGDTLKARIPHQPPAGKVQYHIILISPEGEKIPLTENPLTIRFKGDVPAWALIPHIIFIFGAMLISTRTGLEAFYGGRRVMPFIIITLIGLFFGGFVFGPIVQKFAFGVYWSGWPFGQDLTDNKTLVALIFWAIAFFRIRKNPGKTGWAVVAAIVLIVVFLIPHSLLGSELDYTKLDAEQAV